MELKVSADDLALQCAEYLDQNGYSKYGVWHVSYPYYRRIARYMNDNGDGSFNLQLGQKLVDDYAERCKRNAISRNTYSRVRCCLRQLTEFYSTGVVLWRVEKLRTHYNLSEEYERLLESFLNSRDFHPNTREDFVWAIRRFLFYLMSQNLSNLQDVQAKDIRGFVISLATLKTGSIRNILCYVRQFLEFFYREGTCTANFSYLLSPPAPQPVPIQAYVSDVDLEAILATIPPNTKKGKRDYAIILLGVIYGLRASDIIQLKMSDIDWQSRKISFYQAKSGTHITLPLLDEVAVPLKDYICNVRPKVNTETVFLRLVRPFQALHDGMAISYTFDKYCRLAGVERAPFDGKGFHGLRRRLGRKMLTENIPVSTISQVLGHQNLQTTGRYLNMDEQGLKECALDFNGIWVGRNGLV